MDLGAFSLVFGFGIMLGIGLGLLIGHRARTRHVELYERLAAKAKAAGVKFEDQVERL